MSEAPASPGGGSHESGEHSPRSNIREQDRFLPIANISRIMKKALPANGKIAKDAKETVQECVSEFISFITSEYVCYVINYFLFSFYLSFVQWFDCDFDFDELELCRASDKCQREKRKTINGDDLLWAMATLGFEDYIDPLKIYLTRYREVNFISIYCFFNFLGVLLYKLFWSPVKINENWVLWQCIQSYFEVLLLLCFLLMVIFSLLCRGLVRLEMFQMEVISNPFFCCLNIVILFCFVRTSL